MLVILIKMIKISKNVNSYNNLVIMHRPPIYYINNFYGSDIYDRNIKYKYKIGIHPFSLYGILPLAGVFAIILPATVGILGRGILGKLGSPFDDVH